MKLSLRICLVIGCVLLAQSTGGAQEPDEFRTVVSGFGIKLPKTFSDYRNVSMEVAKYRFPTRIYRWNKDNETFTIWFGEGANDLENPQYAKLFLDDFRNQYVASLKNIGKVLEEHPWSFEGHPGFELIEEHKGRLADVRVFVSGYRFYVLVANVSSIEQQLGDHLKQILDSFRLLSAAEIEDEKERLIASFAPLPLPQQPFIGRLRSDAQDENLRDNVKRIYVEEAGFFGRRQPSKSYPVTREDFDQRGYLIAKIEYVDYLPLTAATYGYLNGSRVFRKTVRPELPDQPGAGVLPRSASELPNTPYIVEHKYSKTGTLEEVRVSAHNGKVGELYSYEEKQRQRQISFSEKTRDSKDLRLHWKTLLNLDDDGNPIAETRMEYFQVTKSKFISFEKPVDVYAVVSGAIRGPGFPPANAGSIKSPTVADVVRNPHTTARVIESVDESALEKASETKYTYTYEYDSHHNWIKRITSLVARSNNFRPVQISATYRTITYY